MTIKNVPLDLIDDNPYNPRIHFPRAKIDELARSIELRGILEVPRARPSDGRFQLAFGQMRKRALQKLAKENPDKFTMMPLDVQEISDEEMFYCAVEENLKRADLKPIEVARGVNTFLEKNPDTTEETLAQALDMSQANISHMRRVLRLPDEVLEKIDEDIINLAMGRELIIFADLENGKDMMLSAIQGLRTGNKTSGHPVTVQGIQKSIDWVAETHLRALQGGGYYQKPDFDIKAAGCHKCPSSIATHPTKSQVNRYCTKPECWEEKQAAHRRLSAEAAKAKMEADIIKRAAGEITPPPTAEPAPAATITQVIPCDTCALSDSCDRSYFHVADDSDELVCEVKIEKPVPDDAATTAPPAEELPTELAAPAAAEVPADLLALAKEKAGTRAEILDLKDIRTGSYGDVKEGFVVIKGEYSSELAKMDDAEECVERCTQGFHYAFDSERRGYHEEGKEPKVFFVCTNPTCVARKKGAFTRKRNAQGNARKKTEANAIKEAIGMTTALGKPQMKLILLSQVQGSHIGHYYGGDKTKEPKKWLWDKISAGVPEDLRALGTLWKLLDKLSDEELAKLVVEMCFYYLVDRSEPERFEIKAKEPLKWFGISVKEEGEAPVTESSQKRRKTVTKSAEIDTEIDTK